MSAILLKILGVLPWGTIIDFILEKINEEPDRPSESRPKPQQSTGEIENEEPEIVDLDVRIPTHGRYLTRSGKARGVVVHYTAGHHGGKVGAERVLKGLAKRGLGCLVMDEDGVIYRGKNQDIDEIAWHAGKSAWKGKTGISRYCIGMEIMCAGKLDKNNKSWFDKVYPDSEVRIDGRGERWHKYTKAQERSLKRFIAWQKEVNPEFDADWIVGHHEIAPKRKTDPGNSLSISMDSLRRMFK